jgi:hypothetical protein
LRKTVGRGVFLDVARALGKEYLDDGYGITCADLDLTASKQKVEFRRGDYIIVRTGQMERCTQRQKLGRLSRRRCAGFRLRDTGIRRPHRARRASDTRPNNTEGGINQPWHWITVPIMGMTMGEIFYVKDLAEDCAADGVYEFMFVAPAIPITGAVGSPTNPLAIK